MVPEPPIRAPATPRGGTRESSASVGGPPPVARPLRRLEGTSRGRIEGLGWEIQPELRNLVRWGSPSRRGVVLANHAASPDIWSGWLPLTFGSQESVAGWGERGEGRTTVCPVFVGTDGRHRGTV